MKPEAQRIAIAEACGFTVSKALNIDQFHLLDNDFRVVSPWFSTEVEAWMDAPDYPNDLNAMHEAENMLKTHDQNDSYVRYLYCGIDAPMPFEDLYLWIQFEVVNATAAQRAEAFLRTIGKWVEE